MENNSVVVKNEGSSSKTAPRNYWLDLARLVMAIFVVATHTTRAIGWQSDWNQPMLLLNSSLFRIAVPFFFLLTSYFAYDRYLASGRDGKVLFKTGLRYLGMYLFWIVLYLGIIVNESYVMKDPRPEAGAYVLWFFQELFLNSPISVFWFLRASGYGLLFLGALFLIPKMKPIYLLPWALGLFTFGAFGDSYFGFVSGGMLEAYQGYFKIFYYTRNMMFGALPMFIIGFIIRDYQDKIPETKKANIILYVLLGLSFVLLFLESYLLCTYSKPKDFNIFFSLLLADPLLFLVLLRIKKPLKLKVAPYLADISSLVYFTHIAYRDLYNILFLNTAYANSWHLRFFLVLLAALFTSCAIVFSSKNSKIKKWIY